MWRHGTARQRTHPPIIMAMVIMMVMIAVPKCYPWPGDISTLSPGYLYYLDGAAVWCGLEVTHAIGTPV